MFISFIVEFGNGRSQTHNPASYNKILKRLRRIEKSSGRKAVEKYLLEIYEKALRAMDNGYNS